MKKFIKFLPLISVPLLPLAAISCKKESIEKDPSQLGLTTSDLNFNLDSSYKVPVENFSEMAKNFDQRIKYSTRIDNEDQEVEGTIWEKFGYAEATLDHWADGDTATFIITSKHGNFGITQGVGSKVSIRIATIDTLEENTDSVKEAEKKLAKIDTAYARKLIPVGKKVRIISDGSPTYNRYAGNIFFSKTNDDTFESNFAIEMLAAGYTLPRINVKNTMVDFEVQYKSVDDKSLYSWLLPYAAYAMNYAIVNKKGFYKDYFKNIYSYGEAYVDHGIQLFSDGPEAYILPELSNYAKLLGYQEDGKYYNNVYKFIGSKLIEEINSDVESITTKLTQIGNSTEEINKIQNETKDLNTKTFRELKSIASNLKLKLSNLNK